MGRLPITLSILPTYRCTAACEECCFGCGPDIQGQIPSERICSYIDQVAAIDSVRQVVFSGGEPFLIGAALDVAVAEATNRRMHTRCVTNAFWAQNEETSYERLKKLKKAGLKELNISTGDHHQKFVPPDNVVYASRAALELDIQTVVVVESMQGREFTAEDIVKDSKLSPILSDFKKKQLFQVIQSPWISVTGNHQTDHDQSMYLSRENLMRRHGCDSVLSSLAITPREELRACCGILMEKIPELNLGSLREKPLAMLCKDAQEDFMKIWLYVEGPEHILEWLARKDPCMDWEGKYVHQCEVCRALYRDFRIRELVRENFQEKVPDVLFRFSLLDEFRLRRAVRNPLNFL